MDIDDFIDGFQLKPKPKSGERDVMLSDADDGRRRDDGTMAPPPPPNPRGRGGGGRTTSDGAGAGKAGRSSGGGGGKTTTTQATKAGQSGGTGGGKKKGRESTKGGAKGKATARALTEEEKAAEIERLRAKEEEIAAKKAREEEARAKEEAERAAAELETRRVEIARMRETRRRARGANASPSRPTEDGLKGRDSSIKKNTTVLKKLRLITEQNKAGLIQDLSKVNVSKYVTEAATACVEGKMKSSDVFAAVEIISLLHQTYVDFSAPLVEALRTFVLPPQPEALLKMAEGEAEALPSPLQRRTKLRLFMELYLVGVCGDAKPVLEAVKEMARLEYKTAPDLYQHSLSTLASFAKTFNVELLGATSEVALEAEDFTVPQAIRDKFKAVLTEYCDRLFMVLMEAFHAVTNQEREMARLLEKTGAVSETASVEFAALTKVFDGLLKGASTLAEALGRELPEMKKTREEKVQRTGTMELHRGGVAKTGGNKDMWEDEDQQYFYETLPDLRASIPAVLLATESYENETEAEKKAREKEEEAEGRSAKLEGLVMRLSDCLSKDKADAICTDFCYIAARGGRKRLVREFINVRRSDMDRIPFYCRMIATLSTVFDEMASSTVELVKTEFDYLVQKGKRAQLEDRLKNAKFLAELVKFKVIPDATVFQVIQVLLDDFHEDNVDVLCSFFDSCGFYLARAQSSSKRMNSILDILLRLKAVSNLDARRCALVDSAYYTCRPIQKVIERKVRPPLHEYIRNLIYSQLSRKTLQKVATQLLKLPWHDTEEYLLKRLFKACRGSHDAVPLVASLIARLSEFYPTLAVRALDTVFEDIRFGLETNETWMHQRRISNMRLLGFMYKERIAHFRELLDTLYLIILIGYDGRQAHDHPKDTIRLRMVCTLLDTAYKVRGAIPYSHRKDIDKFLLFFQRYALTKNVPLDISNDVVELMLTMNPQMNVCETFEEADLECKKLLERGNDAVGSMEPILEEDEESDVEDDDEDEDDEDDDEEDEEMEAASSDESIDESMEESSDIDVSDTETTDDFKEQEVKVRMAPERASLQEEREFEREMNKFLGGSSNPASSMIGTAGGGRNQASNSKAGSTIAFKMLVKNQGKQLTKELNVPESAEFVANVKQVMKAEEAELAKVRRRVLNSAIYDDAPVAPGPRFSQRNVRREHNISRRL